MSNQPFERHSKKHLGPTHVVLLIDVTSLQWQQYKGPWLHAHTYPWLHGSFCLQHRHCPANHCNTPSIVRRFLVLECRFRISKERSLHFPSFGLYFLMRGWQGFVAFYLLVQIISVSPLIPKLNVRSGGLFFPLHGAHSARSEGALWGTEWTWGFTSPCMGLAYFCGAHCLLQALDGDSEVCANPSHERRPCQGIWWGGQLMDPPQQSQCPPCRRVCTSQVTGGPSRTGHKGEN